ncbi:MAG: YHS domain-containing (seleno)protein, partial [Pseudomonadota bacterium]
FVASPTSFAPKYGGYCAYAAALGSKAKGDPRAWKIVDGKLYLNYNQSIKRKWERKQSAYIQAADKKWK